MATKKTAKKPKKATKKPDLKVKKSYSFEDAFSALEWLESKFNRISPKTKAAMALIENNLQKKVIYTKKSKETNILDITKKIFLENDDIFLKKQLKYHISASADIPPVHANEEELLTNFKGVLEYIAKQTPRGGKVMVNLEGYPLRGDPGIKCSMTSYNPNLKQKDESDLLSQAFLSPDESPLASCRQFFAKNGGQLWMEIPVANTLIINFVLPTYVINKKPMAQEVIRYDITATNYPSIRKRFGKKKSLYLLREIERFIKTLVRYPFDIVVSHGEKGLIVVLYESPPSSSRSVASRISQRLGSERFQIGKNAVSVDFKYVLSSLTHTKNA